MKNAVKNTEIKIGSQVSVDKYRGGYWVGFYKGEVTDLKDGFVKVNTWQNGNRWYAVKNVTLL